MKKNLILLSILLMAVSLAGCVKTEPTLGQESITVPLLIQERDNTKMKLHFGVWNVKKGVIEDRKEIAVLEDELEVSRWDGGKKIVVEELPASTPANDFEFLKLQPQNRDAGKQTFWTETLDVIQESAGDKRVFHLKFKNGTAAQAEKRLEVESNANELRAIGREGDEAYLFFLSPFEEEQLTVHYIKYNYKTEELTEKSCPVPQAYVYDVHVELYSSALFHDKKLYMSGGGTLLYLDVEKNEMIALEELTTKAKEMIPNTSQTNLMGLTPPITPICVVEDTVVFSLPVYEKRGKSHAAYFAIKENEFVGAIDAVDNSLHFYNNDLRHIAEDTDYTLSGIPLIFPKISETFSGELAS